MKKIGVLAIALIGWISILNAQIVITSANYGNIGAYLVQKTDTLPVSSITPGSSGINATWNFSALHSHITTVDSFINPTAGLLGSSYPTSNLCMNQGGVNYVYFDTSSTGVKMLGNAGDLLANATNHALVLSDPETIITFPSTFTTTFTDSTLYDSYFNYGAMYSGYFVDSVREKKFVIIHSNMDGFGTVTTPNASFPCLRQNILKNIVDSMWAKVVIGANHYWINLSNKTSSVQSYSYITNNVGGGPIVDIQLYPDSATAIQTIRWNPAVNTGISNLTNATGIEVYPNPVSTTLSISKVNNDKVFAGIYDITGREVLAIGSITEQNTKVPVGKLENGTYFVKIFNNSGLVKTEKIVIVH